MKTIIATIVDTIRTEPAVVVSTLTALIGLAVTLGFVQDEQAKAVVGTVTVLVPMLASLLIRAKVTPTADLPDGYDPRHDAPAA